jgi:hypothetical protein
VKKFLLLEGFVLLALVAAYHVAMSRGMRQADTVLAIIGVGFGLTVVFGIRFARLLRSATHKEEGRIRPADQPAMEETMKATITSLNSCRDSMKRLNTLIPVAGVCVSAGFIVGRFGAVIINAAIEAERTAASWTQADVPLPPDFLVFTGGIAFIAAIVSLMSSALITGHAVIVARVSMPWAAVSALSVAAAAAAGITGAWWIVAAILAVFAAVWIAHGHRPEWFTTPPDAD